MNATDEIAVNFMLFYMHDNVKIDIIAQQAKIMSVFDVIGYRYHDFL